MDSARRCRAEPGRQPARHRGGAAIAVIAVIAVLMLVLAAGVSSRAAKMLANSAPPPSSAASVAPHAERGAEAGGEPETSARAAGAEDPDDHALARAAEAGLRGMRMQYAQAFQATQAGAGAALDVKRQDVLS